MATLKIYLAIWLVTAALLSEVKADDEDEGVDSSSESVEEDNFRSIPYLAVLRDFDTFDIFCGGSILSNRHILTAASCVQTRDKNKIVVTLDHNKHSQPIRIYYHIRNKIIPKEYKPSNNEELVATFDIAILILANELEGKDWRSVESKSRSDILETRSPTLKSYFTAATHYKFGVTKVTLGFPLRSVETCTGFYKYFTTEWFCGNMPIYVNILVGSPYIYELEGTPYVVGITLNSEKFKRLGTSYYPIFITNVAHYITAIQKILLKSFNTKNLQSESYIH